MFKLDKSPNDMMCLSIKDQTKDQRWYIKRALRANHLDDPFYKARRKANPFLQCDDKTYILVEFWTNDREAVLEYIKFLNENFDREVKQARRLRLI